MTISRQYLRDRLVLLLVSGNIFLGLLLCVMVGFRLSTGHNSYFVQYRSNLGVNAFQTGSVTELISFIVFGLLVLGFHLALSHRTYHIHRQLSVIILGLGIVLQLLALVSSNALLALR
jgi:hypothetical protein